MSQERQEKQPRKRSEAFLRASKELQGLKEMIDLGISGIGFSDLEDSETFQSLSESEKTIIRNDAREKGVLGGEMEDINDETEPADLSSNENVGKEKSPETGEPAEPEEATTIEKRNRPIPPRRKFIEYSASLNRGRVELSEKVLERHLNEDTKEFEMVEATYPARVRLAMPIFRKMATDEKFRDEITGEMTSFREELDSDGGVKLMVDERKDGGVMKKFYKWTYKLGGRRVDDIVKEEDLPREIINVIATHREYWKSDEYKRLFGRAMHDRRAQIVAKEIERRHGEAMTPIETSVSQQEIVVGGNSNMKTENAGDNLPEEEKDVVVPPAVSDVNETRKKELPIEQFENNAVDVAGLVREKILEVTNTVSLLIRGRDSKDRVVKTIILHATSEIESTLAKAKQPIPENLGKMIVEAADKAVERAFAALEISDDKPNEENGDGQDASPDATEPKKKPTGPIANVISRFRAQRPVRMAILTAEEDLTLQPFPELKSLDVVRARAKAQADGSAEVEVALRPDAGDLGRDGVRSLLETIGESACESGACEAAIDRLADIVMGLGENSESAKRVREAYVSFEKGELHIRDYRRLKLLIKAMAERLDNGQ